MIRLFWKAWLLPIPQSETIIANRTVSVIKPTDAQKLLNLKHAWEFILNKDVLSYGTNSHIFCYIAKSENEGFYSDGGRILGVPVTLGGTSYVALLPKRLHNIYRCYFARKC